MSATEVVETELGRNEESEEEAIELEVSEAGSEAGAKLTDEKVEEIRAFILQEPESEAPNTAREKRLAAQRQKIEDQLELMSEIGELINNPAEKFRITEGGKTHKVSVRELWMSQRLKIRNKQGRLVAFKANAAQRDFAKSAGTKSIILKARQLGMTTYVAARFFLNCITRPGTVCVQVAHDQRAAEEIFRTVHRMLANLPTWMRKGVLATSQANKRKIVFPHIEGLFGHKSGAEKKKTALTLVQNTIQATDAIAGKDILDPNKFQDGLGKVIDGVVQCLNSSAWAKAKSE